MPQTGNAMRSSVTAHAACKEVETCGLCHARRGQFSEDWVPGRSLSDTHVVSPLARGLYHADGQMLDEVYNYGSFKQSKMFAAGVTCSDCHDPHSAKLRALRRRRLPAMSRARQIRGRHAPPSCRRSTRRSPARRATCRPRTYMVVDRRHDHSFRIPRPDLSVKLGTPNACNDCHADKSAEWAAVGDRGLARARAAKGLQNYADAFHAAWNDEPGAADLLAARRRATPTLPPFARAGALAELCRDVSHRQLSTWRARACPMPTRWCASARSTCWTTCRRTSSGRW